MAGQITFERKLTLGNMIQITMLGGALTAGYFGMKASIGTNSTAIEMNANAIQEMRLETQGLDVLNYKVDSLTATVDRIEKKINHPH